MPDFSKKGIILFIVISVILVVVTLITVVLGLISNHSRLTHHTLSRIQAQYAAKAGMVYALDMLRKGTDEGGWAYSPDNSCPNPTGCPVGEVDEFPSSSVVRVVFCPKGENCGIPPRLVPCNPPDGSDFCINTFVDFTHTAP